MLELTITIDNDIQQAISDLEDDLEHLIDHTLFTIQHHIEIAMRLPKFGSHYGHHIASQPGEPPAIDTRDLIESGVIEKKGRWEGTLTYTSDHAAAMEYGSLNAAPRPYVHPSVEAERPRFAGRAREILP